MAVALVVKRRFKDLVVLFDDETAARAWLSMSNHRGERKNALKTSWTTGKIAVLDVDDTNVTP